MAGVVRRVRSVVDEGGARSVVRRALQFRDRVASGGARPIPVADRDYQVVKNPRVRVPADRTHLRFEWLIPPVAPASGGHTNVMRLVRYLEQQGHTCHLRFHDPTAAQSPERASRVLASHFPPVNAALTPWHGSATEADVLVATSWQTAWAAASARTEALRAYLIQDYEPWFYPAGSHAAIAARTYELGLVGVALGEPLAELVRQRHGMTCSSFAFGVDAKKFRRLPHADRKGIVFYGRPETPRRGFELGCAALRLFARAKPSVPIHVIGGAAPARWFPPGVLQHGVLGYEQLNELYNRCRVGLVLSFTNVSLLPLELLSAGCVPVLNDLQLARDALGDLPVRYAPADPSSLALALADAWDESRNESSPVPINASSWESSADRFLRAIEGHLPA